MKIKNESEYFEALRKRKAKIYLQGKLVDDVTANNITKPHCNCAGLTYSLGNIPEYEDLLFATSHLTGNKISRFTHIHQSCDDLVKKIKMLRLLGQKSGSCFQRCAGFDALNAVYSVSYEIDKKYRTHYHQRFIEYLKYVQSENIMVGGAMTDAKGDRSLRPSEQKDKDSYVHIVDKKKNGVVIRGAKLHQTGAANSHEILVIPTTALKENERDFAISCAVPIDAEGVLLIFGRQANDTRRDEGDVDCGNPKYGSVGGECLIVFDDVFIPEERVFMCGEVDFSGMLVERFASIHRANYGACKVGFADVLIGATALIAEYQGIDKVSHVKDKITEMIHLTETLHSCALTSAYEGIRTSSGAYIVHPLYANVTKHNATRYLYEIARLSHDIAGGFVATIPHELDFKNESIAKYAEKYFKAKDDVPTEYRIKVGRLIENMTSPTPLIEAMQGAGSPQAQRVMIIRQGDIEGKKKLVKDILNIS